MRNKVVLMTLLFVAIVFGGGVVAYAQQGKGGYEPMAAEILKLVNEHRKEKGLPPLKNNPIIVKYAGQHSANMAAKKVPFGHDGFDARIAKIKKEIKNTYSWAENVAYGADDAKGAVEMWLHSEGHRKNIEGDYSQSGIGVVKGKDGQLYFTQIFLQAK